MEISFFNTANIGQKFIASVYTFSRLDANHLYFKYLHQKKQVVGTNNLPTICTVNHHES